MAGIFGNFLQDDTGVVQPQGGVLGGYGPLAGNQKTALLFAGLRDAVNSFSGGQPSNYAADQGQQFYRQNATGKRDALIKGIQEAHAKGDMQTVRTLAMQDPELGASIMKLMQGEQEEFGTTPVRDAKGNAVLIGKRGTTKPLGFGLPDPHAVTPYQQAQLDLSKRGADLSASQFGETRRHNLASEANSGRSVPAGYRPSASGGLEFIPGGPADPGTPGKNSKPTEDQAKNKQLYELSTKMLPQVLKGYDELGSTGNQAGKALSNLPLIGPSDALVTSSGYQQADTGIDSIVANFLYSTSGATATPDEVRKRSATIKPKFGDSAETKRLKKQALLDMVDSIQTRATPGTPKVPFSIDAPASSNGWTVRKR